MPDHPFEIGDTVRVRFDGKVKDLRQKIRIGGSETGDASKTTLLENCLSDFEAGDNGFVEFTAEIKDFDGGLLAGSEKFLVFEMESARGRIEKEPMIDHASHHFSIEKVD